MSTNLDKELLEAYGNYEYKDQSLCFKLIVRADGIAWEIDGRDAEEAHILYNHLELLFLGAKGYKNRTEVDEVKRRKQIQGFIIKRKKQLK